VTSSLQLFSLPRSGDRLVLDNAGFSCRAWNAVCIYGEMQALPLDCGRL